MFGFDPATLYIFPVYLLALVNSLLVLWFLAFHKIAIQLLIVSALIVIIV